MSKRYTTESFILCAKEIHGDKYDYSKVVYNRSDEPVCIICSIHGEFWLTPNMHLMGQGCRKCVGTKRKTTEEFVLEAKKKFPLYDYSKVEYTNNKGNIIVTCPKHGDFITTPNRLLRSSFCCKKCSDEFLSEKFLMTKEYFLEKARKVHGDKYDYSLVEFPLPIREEKVPIICKKHGVFYQKILNHFWGAGCPMCRATRGENLIAQLLDKLNIEYKREYTIKTKHKLYCVDFYLPELNTIIEYNGIQHYKPVKYFGGYKLFFKQVFRDIRLLIYCTLHNISLITIKYNKNIEEMLMNKLNNVK